jgi:hypothetical protein
MRTRDLVKKLRARFGEIDAIEMKVFRVTKHEGKNTVVLEGVLEVVTNNDELLCGGSIVRAECDFLNAIYATPFGALVHGAIMHKPLIYVHFRQGDITFFVYVPCKFDNVDINKFMMVAKNVGMTCPFDGTDKCPLHKVMTLSS